MERQEYKKICKGCGKRFVFNAFRSEVDNRLYCSKSCANKSNKYQNSKSKIGKKNPQYKHGLYSVNSKNGSINKILSKVKFCEFCGVVGSLGTYSGSFIIHHLDENRKNNNINNLKVICRPCHWKVHNG